MLNSKAMGNPSPYSLIGILAVLIREISDQECKWIWDKLYCTWAYAQTQFSLNSQS